MRHAGFDPACFFALYEKGKVCFLLHTIYKKKINFAPVNL